MIMEMISMMITMMVMAMSMKMMTMIALCISLDAHCPAPGWLCKVRIEVSWTEDACSSFCPGIIIPLLYNFIPFLINQDGFVKYDEKFPGQRTLADIDHCRVVLR